MLSAARSTNRRVPSSSVALALATAGLLLAFAPASAFASVVHVATTGSDSAGDGSAVSPYRTVGKGLAAAATGDEVRLAAGTYGAGETFPLGLKGGVSLSGAGSSSTTIHGDGASSVLTDTAEGTATVAGLAVTGGAPWAIEAEEDLGGSTLVLSHVILSGNAGGVSEIGSRLSVTDSAIRGNTGAAVSLDNAQGTISRCTLEDNGGAGIAGFVSDAVVDTALIRRNGAGVAGAEIFGLTMVNAEVTNNTGAGVDVGVKSGGRLVNDTIADNGGAALAVSYLGVGNVSNCIMWGNGSAVVLGYQAAANIDHSDVQGGYAGTGNKNVTPGFAVPGSDYRLAAGSPCIDAGTNTGAPAFDANGLPRPVDGNGDGVATADMGAYEFGQFILPGRNVSIQIGRVRVSFAQVMTTGTVSVSASPMRTSKTRYHVLGGDFYAISTTARCVGSVTVTLPLGVYRPRRGTNGLRLMHLERNRWVDITTGVDVVHRTVTGVSCSL